MKLLATSSKRRCFLKKARIQANNESSGRQPISVDGATVADSVEHLAKEGPERLLHLVRTVSHLLLEVGHGFPHAADRIWKQTKKTAD